MLPGIAAHCDPSLCGDWRSKCPVSSAGDADVQPHREIRVSSVRQYSRGYPSGNHIPRRGDRRRRLPVRTERPNAFRRPLVLPHRSGHQTPLLVHGRRETKALSGRAKKFGARDRPWFAAERTSCAAVDRRCARRTALAADARRTGDGAHRWAVKSSGSCECGER